MDRVSYLSPREVRDRILLAMDKRTPFSLVRVSDGEGLLLGHDVPNMWLSFVKQHQQWFGVDPYNREALHKMRSGLLIALGRADIVGHHDTVSEDVERVFAGWQFQRFADQVPGARTTAMIHMRLQQQGLLAEIVRSAESFTLVTCRAEVADEFRRRTGKPVKLITIPADTRTETVAHDKSGDTGHWASHADLRRECYRSRSHLTLVGAGCLGKAYTVDAARGGSVSIDVGSLFDGWAGLLTRGHIRADDYTYSIDRLFDSGS